MVGMVRVITAVLAGPTGRLGPQPWWSTSSWSRPSTPAFWAGRAQSEGTNPKEEA